MHESGTFVRLTGGRCRTVRELRPLASALAPGCRFAWRIIERTSSKLPGVWSPDAVNNVGGRDNCAVFVVPRRANPGCRFAGGLIPRTAGKLASVWSPDAVHDAGGLNDCTVFVVPSRHGWTSEHGRGDQSYRNKLTHLRISLTNLCCNLFLAKRLRAPFLGYRRCTSSSVDLYQPRSRIRRLMTALGQKAAIAARSAERQLFPG